MVKPAKKNAVSTTAITKSVKNTDFNKFIEKKLQQVIDIIQRTYLSLDFCKQYDIFMKSSIGQCSDHLHTIYTSAQSLKESIPIHDNEMDNTLTIIQTIFDKYYLGVVENISIKRKGAINSCLFINDRYVLKVNTRDPALPPLRREELALTILSKTDVPVPDIVVLDESTDFLPFPYIITSKIEGRDLGADWRRLSPVDKKKLSYDAGILLAKIHSVSFTMFGDITGRTFGESSSWDYYLLKETGLALTECESLCLLSKNAREQILGFYEKNKTLFAEVKRSVLVHNDFHFNNLLHINNKISGIIDFEFAISGDPEFDLKQMYDFFSWYPDCEFPFLEGYESIESLSDNFKVKLLFYKLLLCIQLAPIAKRYWKKRTQRRIDKEISLLMGKIKELRL